MVIQPTEIKRTTLSLIVMRYLQIMSYLLMIDFQEWIESEIKAFTH